MTKSDYITYSSNGLLAQIQIIRDKYKSFEKTVWKIFELEKKPTEFKQNTVSLDSLMKKDA